MEIKLDHLTKVYKGSGDRRPALADVSIEIASGEFFFLLGPSGCGKTTLLRLIAGLIEPSAGRIFFDDTDITGLPVEKRNTALVFQGYALWPHMTVQDNVEFGPRMRNRSRDERRSISDEQLSRVQMNDYKRRKPNQLSGGQQQRVALARALASGADCLLFDEPLSNLDARLRLHMRDELRNLVKSSGITAIYVTHDQKEALSMADRIAVMNDGRIVQIGTPGKIYDGPETRFVADFLGEANFIDGRLVQTGPPAGIRTPLGILLSSSAKDIEKDADVTCCVRPERIRMVTDKEPEAGEEETLLPARIISGTYLGEIRQYLCSFEKQEEILWKVTTLSGSMVKPEDWDRIHLLIPAKDVALLHIQ
jgi:iron(III) transport system ATP-binding protein